MPDFASVPHGTLPAIVVDIDGTVAHNDGHRGFYEYELVMHDKPKADVIHVVQALQNLGAALLFVSGRNDVCREQTANWIYHHIIGNPAPTFLDTEGWRDNPAHNSLMRDNDNQRGRHRLFMRLDGDYREDDIVKYDIYRYHIAPEYDVVAVFDDRDRVVKMWRQVGLTCFQVDYGDF